MIAARVLLLAALLAPGCIRPPPPGSGSSERPGGTAAAPSVQPASTEQARVEAERLKALGPIYTPYDRGPRIAWDEEVQRTLTETLVPVLERHRLPVRTRTLAWVLVGADGAVWDAVVQTSSGNAAFDEAALEVARALRFVPAVVDRRPAGAWVIREISLLMQ